jgi:hypothetical protein
MPRLASRDFHEAHYAYLLLLLMTPPRERDALARAAHRIT